MKIQTPPRGATVAIAMSGGVDSSVAAALCVEAGCDVFGIMLRLWSEPGATGSNKCCTLGAIDDARAVADILDIPFQVLDAVDVFKQGVVDPFLEETLEGETPNPCFRCNGQIRFGYLLSQAKALGADFLATGHYARIGRREAGAGRPEEYVLLRGLDHKKDQSYMLHRLDQSQLAHALFPVGGLEKSEVRRLAEGFGLPVASRSDSVDLCWTGDGGVRGFLGRNLPSETLIPGPILSEAGEVLGQHAGALGYTLGQRRGLGVAAGEPVYVLNRDLERNALIVGPAEKLDRRDIRLEDMHWLSGRPPAEPMRVEAKIRYGAAPAPALLIPSSDGRTALCRFDEPRRAPTGGQGLVAYLGDEVLAGGKILDSSEEESE